MATNTYTVNIGTDSRPYRATLLSKVDGEGVTFVTVELAWTHRIYKTRETARFMLVSTEHGETFVVNTDLESTEFDEDEDLHTALDKAIANLV